jgi:hypothetical protein
MATTSPVKRIFTRFARTRRREKDEEDTTGTLRIELRKAYHAGLLDQQLAESGYVSFGMPDDALGRSVAFTLVVQVS